MTADVERFVHSWVGHSMWLSPVMVVAVCVLGWREIGASIFAGVGVMLILLPLQLLFGKRFAKLRRKTSTHTDARVSTMKDVLDGIRSVRAAAWEVPFTDMIEGLRRKEIKFLFRTAYIKSFNISIFFGSTAICRMVSLLSDGGVGGEFSPAKVFTVVSLFAAARLPLGLMLPVCNPQLPQFHITSIFTNLKIPIIALDSNL